MAKNVIEKKKIGGVLETIYRATLGKLVFLDASGNRTVADLDNEVTAFKTQTNTQLSNFAKKDNTLQTNLYAATSNDLGNPADGVTKENIFANPPLDKMAVFSRHNVVYSGAEAVTYKTPISSGSNEWWEVLTFKSSINRAVQIAIQVLNVGIGNDMYLRTRHNDTTDFKLWSAWQKLSTSVGLGNVPQLSKTDTGGKTQRYNGDLNLINNTCFVYSDGTNPTAHKPGDFNGFVLTNVLTGYENVSGYCTQWFQQTGSNILHVRAQADGVWTDWVQIGSGGNISASQITSGTLPIARGGTGATTAATARSNLGAQANLGFTPVQQGGGINHGSNKVYIGWSTVGTLDVTVDSTNLGSILLSGNAMSPVLPIGRGGTGSTSASAALTALGAAASNHTHSNYADIEYGTWTPRLVTIMPIVASMVTYSIQIGNYIKIGKMVFVVGEIQFPTMAGVMVGAQGITGLPYSILVGTRSTGNIYTRNMSYLSFNQPMYLCPKVNSNTIELMCHTLSGTVVNISDQNFIPGSTCTITFGVQYQIS